MSDVALVDQDANAALVVPEPVHMLVPAPAARVSVIGYSTFSEETPVRPRARSADATARQVHSVRSSALMELASLVDVDHELALRMRKSATEIEALHKSMTLCDAAQEAGDDAAYDGASHEALSEVVRETVERGVGGPLPILCEVSWGRPFRCEAETRLVRDDGRLLTGRASRPGDHWEDACGTRVVDVTTPSRRDALDTVREALFAGTEAVRPAVAAASVDAVMREHIARDYPAYRGRGGHGVGLDHHESPRLVSSQHIVLEEDMVVALEPCIYLEGFGARLEHIIRVTAGREVLSENLGRGAGHRVQIP